MVLHHDAIIHKGRMLLIAVVHVVHHGSEQGVALLLAVGKPQVEVTALAEVRLRVVLSDGEALEEYRVEAVVVAGGLITKGAERCARS